MINVLQVQVWLQRQLFLAQARVQLYEILLLQLRNRRGVDTALENIREVYSKGGTRSNAHTQLASEALAALADNRPGHRIEDVLRRWLPSNEAALLHTGLRTGALESSLEQAIVTARTFAVIRSATLQCIAYPLFFLALMAGIVGTFSSEVMPVLLKIVPESRLTGPLAFMHGLSLVVNTYGLLILLSGVAVMALIAWSLPDYTAGGRRFLDKLPPWSVYRTLQGAAFLTNMGSLMKAQVNQAESLLILQGFASPWLQQRIAATRRELAGGASFGEALSRTGYGFPSEDAIAHIRLLVIGDGAAEALARFGEWWIGEAARQVALITLLIKAFCLLTMLMFIITMALAIETLQSLLSLPA